MYGCPGNEVRFYVNKWDKQYVTARYCPFDCSIRLICSAGWGGKKALGSKVNNVFAELAMLPRPALILRKISVKFLACFEREESRSSGWLADSRFGRLAARVSCANLENLDHRNYLLWRAETLNTAQFLGRCYPSRPRPVAETVSSIEEGSYLRLIHCYFTQLWARE